MFLFSPAGVWQVSMFDNACVQNLHKLPFLDMNQILTDIFCTTDVNV